MAAIVVGAIGLHIINDVLESDEEDDDLEDISLINCTQSFLFLHYLFIKYTDWDVASTKIERKATLIV